MARSQWWVFDQPVIRDPLFVLGVLLGLGNIALSLTRTDEFGSVALVLALVAALPSGLLGVGIVLGSLREILRGRRTRSA